MAALSADAWAARSSSWLQRRAGGLYTPLMVAAERTILDLFPHVDLVVEVRNARKWFEHFKNQDYTICGVNAHNRDSIKQAKLKNATVSPHPGKLRILAVTRNGVST